MCGITITSCSKNINLSTRIKPEEINLLINSIIKTKKNQYVDKLFELVMNYKSDLNFLNYFKSKKERKGIDWNLECSSVKYGERCKPRFPL